MKNRIKEIRISKGISLRALAEKVGTCSYSVINRYEAGIITPPEDQLIRIAHALGVKIEDLYSPDENTNISSESLTHEYQYAHVASLGGVPLNIEVTPAVSPEDTKNRFSAYYSVISQTLSSAPGYSKEVLDYAESLKDQYKYVPQNLKLIRQAQDLTLVQLSKKVSIHKSTLSRIESGIIQPSAYQLIKLADALNVSLPQLVSEKEYVGTPWEHYPGILQTVVAKYLRQENAHITAANNLRGFDFNVDDTSLVNYVYRDKDRKPHCYVVNTPAEFFLSQAQEKDRITLFPLLVEHAIGKFLCAIEDRYPVDTTLIIALPVQLCDIKLIHELQRIKLSIPYPVYIYEINCDDQIIVDRFTLNTSPVVSQISIEDQ